MDPVRDIELRALLSHALDPGRERALRERIDADPALRARLDALRPSRPPPPESGWRVPGAPRVPSQPSATMSFDGSRRRKVYIQDLPDAAERLVLLLVREGEVWRCAWPPDAEQAVPLAQLPLVDGVRSMEWDPALLPGATGWAIALPSARTPIAWQEPEDSRWSAVMDELLAGRVPVLRIDDEESRTRR